MTPPGPPGLALWEQCPVGAGSAAPPPPTPPPRSHPGEGPPASQSPAPSVPGIFGDNRSPNPPGNALRSPRYGPQSANLDTRLLTRIAEVRSEGRLDTMMIRRSVLAVVLAVVLVGAKQPLDGFQAYCDDLHEDDERWVGPSRAREEHALMDREMHDERYHGGGADGYFVGETYAAVNTTSEPPPPIVADGWQAYCLDPHFSEPSWYHRHGDWFGPCRTDRDRAQADLARHDNAPTPRGPARGEVFHEYGAPGRADLMPARVVEGCVSATD